MKKTTKNKMKLIKAKNSSKSPAVDTTTTYTLVKKTPLHQNKLTFGKNGTIHMTMTSKTPCGSTTVTKRVKGINQTGFKKLGVQFMAAGVTEVPKSIVGSQVSRNDLLIAAERRRKRPQRQIEVIDLTLDE